MAFAEIEQLREAQGAVETLARTIRAIGAAGVLAAAVCGALLTARTELEDAAHVIERAILMIDAPTAARGPGG